MRPEQMAGASRGHHLVRTPGVGHGTGFWSLESFLEEKKGKDGVKVNSWARPFPEFCWNGSCIPTILSSAAPWAVLLHPGGTIPLDGSAWASITSALLPMVGIRARSRKMGEVTPLYQGAPLG